jgi:hypothetical protein
VKQERIAAADALRADSSLRHIEHFVYIAVALRFVRVLMCFCVNCCRRRYESSGGKRTKRPRSDNRFSSRTLLIADGTQ